MITRILSVLFCVLVCGCEPPAHVATYSSMSADQAMELLRDRLRSIRSVSAQGVITLEKPNGDNLQLDMVVVIDWQGNARLRAWKLGQAVLDLTLTPSGLWAILPSQESEISGQHIAQSMRQWLRILIGSFDDSKWLANDSGPQLVLKQKMDDGTTIICDVDRKTLTASRYLLQDRLGKQLFSLTLSNYAEFNGIPWPQHMDAAGSAGDIVIDLHDVEINGQLPPKVFHPPTRAKQLPETSR